MAFSGPSLVSLLILLALTDADSSISISHLAARLSSTVAGGCHLVALIIRRAVDATPVAVSTNAKKLVMRPRLVVAAPQASVVNRLSARMWSIGLLALVIWLATAVLHLLLHSEVEPPEGCTKSSGWRGLLCALGKGHEDLLLALEVALVGVLAVTIVLEVACLGKSHPRIPICALAFVALVPGAIAEVESPVSTRGLLLATHVLGVVAWSGGLSGLLGLIRLTKMKLEVNTGFLYIIAIRCSELLFCAAILVLVTGCALAFDVSEDPLVTLQSTPGGALILMKAAFGLVLVLVLAPLQRSQGLPRMLVRKDTNRTRAIYLLGMVELIIMGLCFAIASVLNSAMFLPR